MNHFIRQTVILGGGFTGLYAALRLRRSNYSQSIILIDRQECFRFRPLLYEYFSSQMDARQVMPKFEELLTGSGVIFLRDTVETVDLERREVRLASGRVCPYSHLVIALGSVTGYFGVEGAKEYALPFREGKDAIALDFRLRKCLNQAIQSTNLEERQKLLTSVVVGGGPTGVELAATLADLVPNWYRELGGNPQEVRIILLSRSANILEGDLNKPLRDLALVELENRAVPVELLTEATATAVRRDALEYEHENEMRTIATATVLWTAGTATHPLVKKLPIPDPQRDRRGRLLIEPTMQLVGFTEVFAGGDCAALVDGDLPPTAQVAHQQGTAIAQNLQALAEGREPRPADVTIKGSLMKLGLEKAAANLLGRFEINGELGHLIRQGIYMNVLPTPFHDLKMTAKWIDEAIFERYLEPKKPSETVKWVAGTVVAAVVARKLLQALGSEEENR
ncbi:NAD(P)/FAD-dependent oxidoreductase [Myxosarcina sp. GI1(2024)]